MGGATMHSVREGARETSFAERSDLGWAMSAQNPSATRRRIFIGLSSRSALLASAARRRMMNLELDLEERHALEEMRDDLQRTAEELKSGSAAHAVPERTFAFAALASTSFIATTRPEPSERDAFAEFFEDLADKIDALTSWDSPVDPVAADDVASKFNGLSRFLLQQVARTGEADHGPSRPRS